MTSFPLNLDDPILRLPDVEKQTGLKKSTIYSMIRAREFPRPISLGSRASGWLLSDVNKWKMERIQKSRTGEGCSV